MMRRLARRAVLLVLLACTGCLPYSCRPDTNEALFPADSTSRQVAQTVPADTLRPLWRSTGTEAHPLQYPRTVRFVDDGGVAVSDVERNSLFRFGPDGALRRETRTNAFAVPYLAGVRGDTLVVFNAETSRFDWVVEGRRLPERTVSVTRPAAETLVYPLATDRHLYVKIVGEGVDPVLWRLRPDGTPAARVALPGPYWRRSGVLRTWGPRLVSVSGFRPVVHTAPHALDEDTTPDSLRLVGFDSPMLARSRAYAEGDVQKPPLLAASAAAVGDTLFVLNLRPGWVQVDAYDRTGRLQRRLVEPHEAGNRGFYPTDLDVRRTGEGYRFAVTVRSPRAQVEVFRWRPQ